MAHKVVIVGAGFGGLSAAKALAGQKNLDVTIIDKRNHHLFQPLLYQVATAALSPADIATPIRAELTDKKNIQVLMAQVDGVNLKERTVSAGGEKHGYDYLILACGSSHSYFGHDEWETFAPGLKTLEQATEIRRRILLSFELAEKEKNPEKRKALMSFAIIGAGPTGVELAGSIAEIARVTFKKDFRNIDTLQSEVYLVEAGPRILSSFEEKLSKLAHTDLTNMGVNILCGAKVTAVDSEGLSFGDKKLASKTIIWAAGVAPSSLGTKLGVEVDRGGRVIVRSDWSLPTHKEVFIIGDMSSFTENGRPLPALAPVALQGGRFVARQILRDLNNKPREHFKYLDKGQMATIGRKKAILQFGSWKSSGFVAWIAWLLVHIYYLIGFKNKFFVLVSWSWSYLTFKKGARLIINKEWRD
ncbi:NAD(P)/FAD-dependent oxidoreductase [bacterium]|nr:NAD(P)/FAD-dependent oxidoreductase [bacterium]